MRCKYRHEDEGEGCVRWNDGKAERGQEVTRCPGNKETAKPKPGPEAESSEADDDERSSDNEMDGWEK